MPFWAYSRMSFQMLERISFVVVLLGNCGKIGKSWKQTVYFWQRKNGSLEKVLSQQWPLWLCVALFVPVCCSFVPFVEDVLRWVLPVGRYPALFLGLASNNNLARLVTSDKVSKSFFFPPCFLRGKSNLTCQHASVPDPVKCNLISVLEILPFVSCSQWVCLLLLVCKLHMQCRSIKCSW